MEWTICRVAVFFVVVALLTGHQVSGLSYTVSDCPAHVPHDANVRVYGNSCYYFLLNSQHDYATAKQSCKYLGGFLATVEDSGTQQFLQHVVTQDYSSGFTVWIGLRNSGPGGAYVWENGVEASYFNWASDTSPQVIQDNGCVGMDTDHGGKWRVFPCHYEMFYDTVLPFICQIPISSECQVCGDVDTGVPCSHLDMTFAPYIQCDSLSPYCMNDVIVKNGVQEVFKRCVNESACREQWWEQSSQDPQCSSLSSSSDAQCHFCCHGNDCNRGVIPDNNTLFKPGGGPAAATSLNTQAPTTPKPTTTTTTTPRQTTTPRPTTTTTTPTITTTPRLTTTAPPHHTHGHHTTKPTTTTTTTAPSHGHHGHGHTTVPPTTPILGSNCMVCGNADAYRPCTNLELVTFTPTQCPDSAPYCMNDIVQSTDYGYPEVSQYRRCATRNECQTQWIDGSSDIQLCREFSEGVSTDSVTCHMCCYGDMCNTQIVPPSSTWFKP